MFSRPRHLLKRRTLDALRYSSALEKLAAATTVLRMKLARGEVRSAALALKARRLTHGGWLERTAQKKLDRSWRHCGDVWTNHRIGRQRYAKLLESPALDRTIVLKAPSSGGEKGVMLIYMATSRIRRAQIDMRCLDTIARYLFFTFLIDFSLEMLDLIHRTYEAGESFRIVRLDGGPPPRKRTATARTTLKRKPKPSRALRSGGRGGRSPADRRRT